MAFQRESFWLLSFGISKALLRALSQALIWTPILPSQILIERWPIDVIQTSFSFSPTSDRCLRI